MRTSNPAHAGSLTLDTRLTMAEQPDMALNKIMVGQGPGSSPVEEDKPVAGLNFTELAGARHNTTNPGWEDWDLSAVIGVGSKVVELYVLIEAAELYGARKNGSALVRSWFPNSFPLCDHFLVECDANRVIEVLGPDPVGGVDYYVTGYWS